MKIFLIFLIFLFLSSFALSYIFFPGLLMQLILILGFSTVVLVQVLIYKRIRKHALSEYTSVLNRLNHERKEKENEYYQIESLFSIFSLLSIRYPLPKMRSWAISPDFAVLLISLLDQYKPNVVLEAGSGVSTIIAGYRLQTLGRGRILSLDHETEFAQQSQHNILLHGLQDIAKVIYAPLTDFDIEGKKWLWYDTSKLRDILNEKVDFLIIDGPPYFVQDLSRYPALPLLLDILSDNAIILLDDASRHIEEEIVRLWTKKFNLSSVEKVFTEKGACIIYLKK